MNYKNHKDVILNIIVAEILKNQKNIYEGAHIASELIIKYLEHVKENFVEIGENLND